ncbi:YcjF family protein [Motilimonas eburnea]|uniref:YcjF family protein n=1 Tax=Motilimonas eburnea TaxID=1737488 RepID=UPI001E335CC7|nr:TIGR01620 family protein [Motilimonas eburnea]MCE2570140.1 YcjF family protein [Motilimonas eburnea]
MTDMSNLTPKKVFDTPDDTGSSASIKSAQVFSSDEFVVDEPESHTESLLDEVFVPTRPNWWLRFGLFGLSVGVTWETVSWLQASLLNHPMLGLFYTAVSICLVVALLKLLWSEVSKLNRLRLNKQLQNQAQLLDPQASDGAFKYCQQLAKVTGQLESLGYQNWQAQLSDSHSNQEVLALYRHHVLAAQDQQAKVAVTKWSGEAALLVAISPLALVDMLIILWRNTKMIEAVAKVYGIELGYLSRLKLFKLVISNMIYAAGAEVAADLGTDILGAEMAGIVSARAAQGVAAGLLTARLGFKAMQICRPVPWQEKERPKAKEIRLSLISKLKSVIKG